MMDKIDETFNDEWKKKAKEDNKDVALLAEGFKALKDEVSWLTKKQETDNHNLKRDIKDTSYLSTKYMVRINGPDLPKPAKNEDPVKILSTTLLQKWGIKVCIWCFYLRR